MRTVPEIDLTNPDLLRDPHAVYGSAREQAPVARLRAPGFGPMWAITRHAEGRAVLADPRFELNANSYQRPDVPADCVPYLRTMQEMDGPEHARLRRLVAPAFTTRRADEFRPRIQGIVHTLLDALPPARPVDLVAHFVRPLPMEVICELVGIPVADRPRWREYGAAVAAGHGQAFADAIPNIIAGARAVVAHHRAEPADDLVSDLLHTEDAELVTLVWHLVLAGQTPTALIANAVHALLTHPEQLAALRADPDLMPNAVDELARWCGPQLLTIPRYATEDVAIDGVLIAGGEPVTVVIAAANRDPRVFTDPDRLDLSRTGSHLSFAHGPHFCLGAALARVQTETALTALLSRFPDLALAQEDVVRVPDPATWRLAALPVHVG
ncbi:MAG TPA: cytochrome P450 [Pseudonocardiaceae bacterium]|nr:cytochrome P450 [Pseudonocardiaceae bacterium]